MTSNTGYLETLLQRAVSAKSAAAKSAKPLSEPGSIGGETTHPVKSVDDGLEKPNEGARAKENERDSKEVKQVDPPDLKSEGDANTNQDGLGVGVTQSPVGGDPKVEDAYKGTKDDPGSTHPARADNKGEKYAEVRALPLEKQAGVVIDQVEKFLAKVAAAKSASANAPAPVAAPAAAPAPTYTPDELAKAAEAGYKAADSLAAQHALGVDVITKFAHDADHMAQLTAAYLQQKQAEAEAQMMGEPGMEQMGGGMPPEAAMGGGMGGEPDGDEGGQIDPAAIQELLAVLAEKGISLEDLEALAAQEGEGAEGGMPPEAAMGGGGGGGMGALMGGGQPPKMASVKPSREERATIKFAAAAAREYLDRGLYRPGKPTNQKAAELRDEMRRYFGELFGK